MDTPKVLRVGAVCERTGLSRVTIWKLIVAGRFPKNFKLTGNRVGWLASEVDAWILERVAERDAETAREEASDAA